MLTLLLAVQAQAQAGQWDNRYTEERPLTVACDWEFPPYEFSNDRGEADGYHVKLLSAILDAMGIPHQFVMKESFVAVKDFEEKRADLIVDRTSRYEHSRFYSSRSILNYCNIVAAVNKERATDSILLDPDHSMSVMLKVYDDASQEVVLRYDPDLMFVTTSVNEAIVSVSSLPDNCFVWDEQSLKWFVHEMNLDNIKTVKLAIPPLPMRLVGHDKQLIDEIDDQYARLEQSGKLHTIYDEWFHPEQRHNDASPVSLYVVLAVVLAVVVLMLLNRLAKQRARQAAQRTQELEHMMLRALSMSNYAIVEYDGNTGLFSNRHGHMIPDEGTTRKEILHHIHKKDIGKVTNLLTQLLKGENKSAELELMWWPLEQKDVPQPGPDDDATWQHLRGHVLIETDDRKHLRRILFTVKFVTDEVRQELEVSNMASRYTKIFETSMIAMSFYDKDGKLVDVNQQMRELCAFDSAGLEYFRQSILFDNPYFRGDIDPMSRDHIHVCQHMYYAELGLDKYLEVRIAPTFDDSGQPLYYTVTARDVTDERTISLEQVHHDSELQAVYDQINIYEQQLYYLLEHSDMWVWQSDLKTQTISFARSLRKMDSVVSFQEFRDSFCPEQREKGMEAFGNLIGVDRNFNATFEFTSSPVKREHQWLTASGIPVYNDDHTVKGHFGIVRDITRLMETQDKLRQETQRADESGKLKSVFLANMTHEIRTPLNAIVGFSDLLQMIDTPDDRQEFIRIIRNNCDMLLRLIDDIIEASNMNQGPIAINADEVDFAQAFSDICQTLAQRVQEPGVRFIVDNPYSSFVTVLDKGRMQQVITNFTTNAVKYTHEGHIKVGWRYTDGGIYMYCEDTGAGIPQDKQASVFGRFVKLNDYVQGTGLGLSICKSIADRCGGRIGVDSKGEGHGCTFWIWIPCECKAAKPLVS